MFKGKVAVVTGAGQGIGQGVAEALFRRGASVVLADLDEALVRGAAEALAATADCGQQAIWMRTDVSRQDDVAALFAAAATRLGRVGILVNNAGIINKAPTLELDEAQFQRVLDVNLKGVLFASQQAARAMLEHGGAIVNIASVAAHASVPGTAAYSVSKSAMLALTRVMATEWGRHRIRVNSVSPSGVETAMGRELQRRDPEGFARRALRVPLAGTLQVADVAEAVLYLASEQARYVTGQDILIDGGLLLQNPGFVP
jgi:NAD(P)-dependent dehydrogenase (short-subunit alcohol dehydrogenase family)